MRNLLIVCCLTTLIGCGPAYIAQRQFETNCWDIQDTLTFDLAQTQPFFVDLTLGRQYAYQNIFLKLRYMDGDNLLGEQILADTLIAPDGNWLDEGGGQEVAWTLPVTPEVTNGPSSMKVQLFHFMRDTTLCQVGAVGVWMK